MPPSLTPDNPTDVYLFTDDQHVLYRTGQEKITSGPKSLASVWGIDGVFAKGVDDACRVPGGTSDLYFFEGDQYVRVRWPRRPRPPPAAERSVGGVGYLRGGVRLAELADPEERPVAGERPAGVVGAVWGWCRAGSRCGRHGGRQRPADAPRAFGGAGRSVAARARRTARVCRHG
ncbi:hypothetical protein ACF1AB_39910 [Streptomyces sp. NPDC014846]|uniref:hypothetical protein n=1 Tax=Streptomyces sp. NPDC014846 TaxID=3364922 RepID=UPI0036F94AD2